VFFSSHQIAEVEQIADRVAIIEGGRAVLAGALDDLRESFRRVHLVFAADAPRHDFRSPGIAGVRRTGRMITLLTASGPEAVMSEARALDPVSVEVVPVTLKEIFLETVAGEGR